MLRKATRVLTTLFSFLVFSAPTDSFSGIFQGLAPRNVYRNLLIFNVPRAAVNFNDGAGGGSELAFSLLFNTCRE